MVLSNKQKAILALIIANMIWGAASPIFKWSLQNIHPFTLAFFRFYLGSLILLPFLPKTSMQIARKDWRDVFLVSFFGIFINITFFFFGLTKTSSINAPIIASSGPIFLLLGGMFLLREHPGMRKISGGIMGLFGILLILLQPIIQKGLDGTVNGNLLLFVAMIASVIPILLLRKLTKTYDPMILTIWAFIISAILFSPFVVYEILKFHSFSTINYQGFAGILFGAVFSSAIAYFLNYWAIKYLLASEVGLFTYIDPVIAIIIAGPLLGEVPTTTFLLGSLLVFLGIYIAEGRIHYHPFHKFFEK